MRYFFNIVQGGTRVQDLEGGDFDSDREAEADGLLVAREIIGRELIAGKLINWAGKVEIVREDGAVIAAVGFAKAANLPRAD
jgi:hypothetical protein